VRSLKLLRKVLFSIWVRFVIAKGGRSHEWHGFKRFSPVMLWVRFVIFMSLPRRCLRCQRGGNGPTSPAGATFGQIFQWLHFFHRHIMTCFRKCASSRGTYNFLIKINMKIRVALFICRRRREESQTSPTPPKSGDFIFS